MTVRPSLVRSIPFWILLVGSLAVGAYGAWLTVDTLGGMSTRITDGTASAVDVYVGQVWAIIGGILIATGVVGLALALVLAVIRSFVPVTDVEIIEGLDWADDDEDLSEDAAPADQAEPVVASEAAVASEPATAEPAVVAEPVAADGDTGAAPETSPQR